MNSETLQMQTFLFTCAASNCYDMTKYMVLVLTDSFFYV